VVLVTVDTLRADFVSFLGHKPVTTPFLDRLAANGTVFAQAYAPSSWTAPSMASLFTGLPPASHGVVHGRIEPGPPGLEGAKRVTMQPVLPSSLTTLAERFEAAGWVTVGVPSNLHLASSLGFQQGFQHYFGAAEFMPADRVNREVERQLRRAFGPAWRTEWRRRATFLWAHYFDPHDPYVPREPWIHEYAPDYARMPEVFPSHLVMRELRERHPAPGAEIRSRIIPLYDAEIRFFDAHLEALDATLGLARDDVLLIVTSDHGEEIADHGRLGHGHSLYQELVRVPLLLHWPAALPRGHTIASAASLIELHATIAALAGLPVSERLRSESLASLLRGQGDRRPPELVLELEREEAKSQALLSGDWKLIRERAPADRVQLFHLKGDAGERRDVSREHPALTQELDARLSQLLEAHAAPPADAGRVPVRDPGVSEQLRDLGYLR
jgi:arylsulfatase A-like enzyme